MRRTAAPDQGDPSPAFVPHELLQQLTHEAEGPAALAANVQLEGTLLQLVAQPSGFLAIYASGPLLSSITVAVLETADSVEVRCKCSRCASCPLCKLLIFAASTQGSHKAIP